MPFFQIGKLPPEILEGYLSQIPIEDDRVVLGPGLGMDASVIDMGDRYLVATMDPVTFAEKRIGWYAVNVNANDAAVMGAKPRWFLVTLLLPQDRTDSRLVDTIFKDILDSCLSLGITLCGGHTEVTAGLERPLVIGQMLGEAAKDRLVTLKHARPGDRILLTGNIAAEGTALLAMEREQLLVKKAGKGPVSRAMGFLDKPGISVVKAALTAGDAAMLHGMHDPTEGGIATGLWELAMATGLGIRVEANRVPFFGETLQFSRILDLDPWGLIASGSLLIVIDPRDLDTVVDALEEQGIGAACIGNLVPAEEGRTIVHDGKSSVLKPFERDELTRLF